MRTSFERADERTRPPIDRADVEVVLLVVVGIVIGTLALWLTATRPVCPPAPAAASTTVSM